MLKQTLPIQTILTHAQTNKKNFVSAFETEYTAMSFLTGTLLDSQEFLVVYSTKKLTILIWVFTFQFLLILPFLPFLHINTNSKLNSNSNLHNITYTN